jgi:type III secretion protein L
MSYTLFHPLNGPALGTSQSVVKAHERQDFTDAAALLNGVRRIKEEADTAIAAQQAAAAQEGRQIGYAEVNDVVGKALAEFARQIAEFETERRDEIANAAFAAVRAIIGDLDDEVVLRGLVTASLSRMDGATPITLEIAPSMVAAVESHFAGYPNLAIRANEALGPHDCQLLSVQGRVVADLQLQLDALAERWGLNT